MKSTLEKRILLFAFITLTLTITVNTVLNIEGFRRDYRDGIILRSQGLAEGLKMSIENVLALGLDLVGIDGISERCVAIVETDPEISYCVVEDSVGTPLYASDQRFRFTEDVELVSAISKSTALLEYPHREKYYDVSLSLYGAGGELSGRIRIGFSEQVLQERIRNILQRSLVVLGIAFFIVFTVVFLFTKKDLIGPISRLCSVAKGIAGGDFNVTVPVMSTRDFSELGDALEFMARSLKERDEKIQQSYAELEQTNLQLQESYENLEKIGSELGRSREMYRSLLEDASDAIVVSDEEDRIVLVNKVAEEFSGPVGIRPAVEIFIHFLSSCKVRILKSSIHFIVRFSKGIPWRLRFVLPVLRRIDLLLAGSKLPGHRARWTSTGSIHHSGRDQRT